MRWVRAVVRIASSSSGDTRVSSPSATPGMRPRACSGRSESSAASAVSMRWTTRALNAPLPLSWSAGPDQRALSRRPSTGVSRPWPITYWPASAVQGSSARMRARGPASSRTPFGPAVVIVRGRRSAVHFPSPHGVVEGSGRVAIAASSSTLALTTGICAAERESSPAILAALPVQATARMLNTTPLAFPRSCGWERARPATAQAAARHRPAPRNASCACPFSAAHAPPRAAPAGGRRRIS